VRRAILVTALLALAAVAGFLVSRQTADVDPPAEAVVPAYVPDVALPDLDGNEQRLRSYLGRPLIINFWATWCPPCLREIPLLIELRDRAGEAVGVVGVAVDRVGPVRTFVADSGMNYPTLVGEQAAMDAAEAFGDAFVGLPFTVIAAADGAVLDVHLGEIERTDAERIGDVLIALAAGEIDAETARRRLAH
jgi:thiol-disulfide isomerase/thioredoxin